MKQYIRSLILPLAILFGFVFHRYCGALYSIVPYLVFTMLFLNYTAVDVKKMHIGRMDAWLLIFQVAFSLGSYLLLKAFGVNSVLCEAVLISVLTPVAASVVVISCALGANRETVTTGTILGNLMVAVVAPIYFSFIGRHQDMPFLQSFWLIFCRIAPQIVFPFFTALILQRWLPEVNQFFVRYKSWSLYVWALTLTIVLGRTFNDIITAPNPHWHLIAIMAIMSVVLCFIQFSVGKWIGSRYGEKIAGGQLLGQKNTSFGIWMAVEYLSPFSAVASAIYSVCQNIFNSWQMYQHDKHSKKSV